MPFIPEHITGGPRRLCCYQPDICWCPVRRIIYNLLLPSKCFCLHCMVGGCAGWCLKVKVLGDLAQVTQVKPVTWKWCTSLAQYRRSSISCLWGGAVLVCWRDLSLDSLRGSFWPEQGFNPSRSIFIARNGVKKEKQLQKASAERGVSG